MPDILSIATTVLGLVGLSGGAAGYFAKSRGDSIIAYQAKELELADRENKRLENANAALTAKSNSQAEQIETLTGLAQGSPQLAKLTDAINKQGEAFGKMASAFEKIAQNGHSK